MYVCTYMCMYIYLNRYLNGTYVSGTLLSTVQCVYIYIALTRRAFVGKVMSLLFEYAI